MLVGKQSLFWARVGLGLDSEALFLWCPGWEAVGGGRGRQQGHASGWRRRGPSWPAVKDAAVCSQRTAILRGEGVRLMKPAFHGQRLPRQSPAV